MQGNFYIYWDPSRFLFGPLGTWHLHLNTAVVGGQPFAIEAFEVCYYSGAPSPGTPIVIEQRDSGFGVVMTHNITSLPAFPQGPEPQAPEGPHRIGEGGPSCRLFDVLAATTSLVFYGLDGQWVSFAGPSWRPGVGFRGTRGGE